jgi:hypothetical protein
MAEFKRGKKARPFATTRCTRRPLECNSGRQRPRRLDHLASLAVRANAPVARDEVESCTGRCRWDARIADPRDNRGGLFSLSGEAGRGCTPSNRCDEGASGARRARLLATMASNRRLSVHLVRAICRVASRCRRRTSNRATRCSARRAASTGVLPRTTQWVAAGRALFEIGWCV